MQVGKFPNLYFFDEIWKLLIKDNKYRIEIRHVWCMIIHDVFILTYDVCTSIWSWTQTIIIYVIPLDQQLPIWIYHILGQRPFYEFGGSVL